MIIDINNRTTISARVKGVKTEVRILKRNLDSIRKKYGKLLALREIQLREESELKELEREKLALEKEIDSHQTELSKLIKELA